MIFSALAKQWLWLALFMVACGVAQAEPNCVEVDGIATIENGDVAFARQMAIRDAVAQAAMSSQVQVTAQSETQNFALTKQSAQFAAQQRVTSMKVLSEAQEGGNMLRVRVSACLTAGARSCPNYIARYKPRIAVASVAVQDQYSVKDIMDIVPGYQSEVYRRLWESGQRNLEQLTTASDLYVGRPITPNLSADLLSTLADRSLAQFLLLTVVRSADWEVEQTQLGKEVRQFFRYDKEPTQRTVSVDWYIVDLVQQRIMMQGNAFKQINDEDVRVGRDKPFGSRQFFVTPTGKAFDYVINEQVKSILDAIACVPIAATIAEVDNGKVIVPISIEAGVAQGDVLAVYSRTTRPYRIGNIDLGTDLEPTAFLRVQKVLPKFIVGTFEGKKGLVQAGDLVKSW
ncbi:MAG: flagellar assembly protein T N-terminal domain-containing protein [Thiotrichales bacterium]|jgi:hypothetical protein|nr:flagellar assembly protein T N-terminal domain-containing protein [Thiotrichales bacterium]